MAGAMEKQDEADYRFAGALVPTRQTGLAYYRRLRPFEIKEWYVLDSATGECLGYLLDGPVEGVEGYAIGRGNAAAPSAKLAAMNKQFAGEESAWEMADRLWRLAYPWKSWTSIERQSLARDAGVGAGGGLDRRVRHHNVASSVGRVRGVIDPGFD